MDIRKVTNLSGAELSRRTGINESLFCLIAKGKRRVTLETAMKVAKHTGVTIDKLLSKAQLKEYGLI
jgi:transcriptional regulator with XRE-family HTH domain